MRDVRTLVAKEVDLPRFAESSEGGEQVAAIAVVCEILIGCLP